MEGPAEPRPAGELAIWWLQRRRTYGLRGAGQAQLTSGHGSEWLERVIGPPVWDSRASDRLYGGLGHCHLWKLSDQEPNKVLAGDSSRKLYFAKSLDLVTQRPRRGVGEVKHRLPGKRRLVLFAIAITYSRGGHRGAVQGM